MKKLWNIFLCLIFPHKWIYAGDVEKQTRQCGRCELEQVRYINLPILECIGKDTYTPTEAIASTSKEV